jgi:beta-fructofuranosidase
VLTLPDGWIWDSWTVDDGDRFHIFFLYAPKSLGDEHRRHRSARIGHAVSLDLVSWTRLPDPFSAGDEGAFDQSATWTGCVVRGDDGLWRMFYTGARFLDEEPSDVNVETVGVAVSDDLIHWEKLPGPITAADPRWYETLGSSSWPEEAWRDPWVFRDPSGDGWHMLVTARANHGPVDDRGVIGHACSPDLRSWEILPPLSQPGSGFTHLEVPQIVDVDGQWMLLFSAPPEALSAAHAARVADAGTWLVQVPRPLGPYDVSAAQPITSRQLYSGKLIRDRGGRWQLLGFINVTEDGQFIGAIADPIPFRPTSLDDPVSLHPARCA